MQRVYRVIPTSDWPATIQAGRVPMCGSDQRDGFVHLATKETVLKTANLYFSADEDPIALEIDAAALGDALVWDTPPGAHGPRLLSEGIPHAAIRACWLLQCTADGRFELGVRCMPDADSMMLQLSQAHLAGPTPPSKA